MPEMPHATPRLNRMRRWALVSPQALAGLRGVLTDIDDTLTANGAIAPAALSALGQLAAAHIPVIAITGRPAGWSEPFALQWPVAAIVAENGAVMLRRVGQALVHQYVDDLATRRANAQRLAACAKAVVAEVPGATLARDSAGRLTDIAVDHSEYSHLDEAHIAQVVAVMRRHGLTAMVSSIHINGWIGAHSKWSGARWAVQQALGLDFDANQWLYVGDSTNDQLMFEHIPMSIGVANIDRFVDQLSVWPAFVTQGQRGDGFAEVASALLAARVRR